MLVACALRLLRDAELVEGLACAASACARLDADQGGVVAWERRLHNGHLRFALQKIAVLALALAAHAGPGGGGGGGRNAVSGASQEQRHGGDPGGALAGLQSLVGLLDQVAEKIEAAEGNAKEKLTSWRLRVALARAATTLLSAAPSLLLAESFCEVWAVLRSDSLWRLPRACCWRLPTEPVHDPRSALPY